MLQSVSCLFNNMAFTNFAVRHGSFKSTSSILFASTYPKGATPVVPRRSFSSAVSTVSAKEVNRRLLPLYKGSVSELAKKAAFTRVGQLLSRLGIPCPVGDAFV